MSRFEPWLEIKDEDVPSEPAPEYTSVSVTSGGGPTPQLIDPNSPTEIWGIILKSHSWPTYGTTIPEGVTSVMEAREQRRKQLLVPLELKISLRDTRSLQDSAGRPVLDELTELSRSPTNSVSPRLRSPSTDSSGETSFLTAVYEGFDDVAQEYIADGIDIEAVTSDGDTALLLAVRMQRLVIVRQLLQAKPNLRAKDASGQTAIFIASRSPSFEIVTALLAASPNASAESRSCSMGLSCLHAAAGAGHIENVKALVATRAPVFDVDEVDPKRGWTPLLAALRAGYVAIAKYLMSNGADPNVRSTLQWTGLHMACYYTSDESLFRMIVSRVIKSTRQSVTEKGSTPVSLAAEAGFASAVRILIKKYRVDTLVRNDLFCTPLYYAAFCGSDETVDILMETDYIADVQSNLGWTALHAACRNCSGDTVKKLAAVTNWTCRRRSSITPFHVALVNENNAAFFALEKASLPLDFSSGWGTTPLLQAASSGNQTVVDYLLEKGADLDTFNWGYYLPINGSYKSRNAFLSKKLRPSDKLPLRLSVPSLDSLVHGAAKLSLDEVKWTLSRGLRINAKNSYHQTPLSIACEDGQAEIVEFFLEQRYANVHAGTRRLLTGWTPLHVAARLRQSHCLEMLMKKSSIDPRLKDCFGLTAFDYVQGHQPSWRALSNANQSLDNEMILHKKDAGQQRNIDVYQLCNIITWLLAQLALEDYQLAFRDTRLAVQAMLDPLLRLRDRKNSLVAIELYLARPNEASNLDPNIVCDVCHRRRNERVYVCKVCPFRLLCSDCRSKSKKEDVKGCYRHEIFDLPSNSWFTRDNKYVDDEKQTEKQWLETVLRDYESQISPDFEVSSIPELNLEDAETRKDVFSLIKAADIAELIEHLNAYPRDIARKDDQKRTVVMVLLEIAESDDECLRKMQLLASVGARMLSFDGNKTSTIRIACERNFEKSLTFILEQWDPHFDRLVDSYSSDAIDKILEKGWHNALKFAIERHFDWAACGRYDSLVQLPIIGLTDKAIIAQLISPTPATENESSPTISESPWAIFDQPTHSDEPQIAVHWSGCVHDSLVAQSGSLSIDSPLGHVLKEENTSRHEAYAGETFESATDPDDAWSDISDDDMDDSTSEPRVVTSSPKTKVDDHFKASQSVDDFDSSGEADEEPGDAIFVLDSVDVVDTAVSLCGLGGLFPVGHVTAVFSSQAAGAREVSISYRVLDAGGSQNLLRSVEVLTNAADGLLEALGRAQKARLYCSGFTILHYTQRNSEKGHPIVRLSQVSLDIILPFVKQAKQALEHGELALASSLERCAILTKPIFKCFDLDIYKDEISAGEALHACSLAMQLLCLGFVSFLGGHLSQFQIPILTSRISHIHLCGADSGPALILAPQKMACIGDMLKDEVFVFSDSVPSVEASTDRHRSHKAFLLARVDDIMELWGPPSCFGEKDPLGNYTGRLLAVYLRQGQLLLTGASESGQKLAHWSATWQTKNLLAFSGTEELLVGALIANECQFDMKEAWDRASRHRLKQLDTREDFWQIQGRQFGFGLVPPHFKFSATMQLNRGVPMKQSVISQWDSPAGYLEAINKPWGVILSICTGFAKRVPLRVAVAEVLDQYLRNLYIDPQGGRQLSNWHRIRKRLRRKLAGKAGASTSKANEDFRRYLREMCDKQPDVYRFIKIAIIFILQHLAQTGLDATGTRFRVAWADDRDAPKYFDFKCSQSQHSWLRLMKDTATGATFAVGTRTCLVAHDDEHAPYGKGTSCRWHLHRLKDLDPTEFQMLQTRVLPCDPGHVDMSRWMLRENMLYKFRPKGSPSISCKLYYLATNQSRGFLKFLLVVRAELRHLILMKREDLREEDRARASRTGTMVLVSTLDDWNRLRASTL